MGIPVINKKIKIINIKPVGLGVFFTGIGSPTTTLTGFLKIKATENI